MRLGAGSDALQVGRLTVHLREPCLAGGLAEAPLARQSAERVLGNAELHPRNLAHAEILLVRNVREDQVLMLTPDSLRAEQGWEDELRARLERVADHAVRPDRGRFVGEPEAIRFTDLAEMLACFALALATGDAHRQWWWRQWFQAAGGTAGMPSALRWRAIAEQHPPAVAASLRLLLSWRRFEEAATVWDALGIASVVSFIAQASPAAGAWLEPCSRIVQGDAEPLAEAAVETEHGRGPVPEGVSSTPARDPDDADAITTWQRLPRALGDELSELWARTSGKPGLRYLALVAGLASDAPGALAALELGRLVHRQGGVLAGLSSRRGGATAQDHGTDESVRIDIAVQGRESSTEVNTSRPHSSRPAGADKHPHAEVEEGSRLPAASRHDEGDSAPAALGIDASSAPKAALERSLDAPHSHHLVSNSALSEAGKTSRPAAKPGSAKPGSAKPGSETDQHQPSEERVWAEHVETALGGVFYLINLSDDDWALPRPTARWAVLDVLARGLCALAGFEDATRDPLWRALAWLDQRAELGDAPDVPDRAAPTSKVPASFDTHPLTAVLDPAWRAWLPVLIDGALTGLENRLAGSPSQWVFDDRLDLLAKLLRAPAQLHLTRTHVDVYMSLQAIAMPLRLAGLDRDPGWRADYARIVQFHFG